jgi:hypothetical protein
MDRDDRRWIEAELQARDRADAIQRTHIRDYAKQIDRLRDSSLSRDLYYREHAALSEKLDDEIDSAYQKIDRQSDDNRRRIEGLEQWRANVAGRIIVTGGAIALMFGLLGALVGHLIG